MSKLIHAIRAESIGKQKQKTISMHRFLSKTPAGMDTDHIDGNPLNNRKCNLRVCTRRQNQCNARPRFGSSKYKGVYWYKRDEKWAAQIRTENGRKTLGYFTYEDDAARAYDVAAKQHYGEFARLNNV